MSPAVLVRKAEAGRARASGVAPFVFWLSLPLLRRKTEPTRCTLYQPRRSRFGHPIITASTGTTHVLVWFRLLFLFWSSVSRLAYATHSRVLASATPAEALLLSLEHHEAQRIG
ncbi:unnamed protein product [Pleuronectes platessa]|uniref:Uncharacterized protein n=1 Tax=Pleuronectes platessa TaxID=8262 RepID=A0A9N7TWY1_PLEPL|nr:unnamed protein product [Pleuronectes platessa]